tara:strand:+ start:309 stop:818 length:510 start_codon:yes stop_codon:yes gene_type:complete
MHPTGNIHVSNELLSKIKQLPWQWKQHLNEDDFLKGGFLIQSINQFYEYGSGNAEKDNYDWGWTDYFIPSDWKDVGLMFNKAMPGYCIPEHVDHFQFYVDNFGYDRKSIRRRLVFLEDWRSGHYFQLSDDVFVKWKQGDWVEHDSETVHLGGNLSYEIRYTLQITGVIK